MSIGPGDARRLTLWEYEAMLADNADRYGDPKGDAVTSPDRDVVKERLAALAADPRFTH